ncbi:Lrp/AsnC family transcriptional regulator [Actibacterium ureilyticum]|uniref:Lrp/AsnC family transcriptional regulator n=1 Tax=Actibacterium ureilyticum TaxID=1590614 RepID=UPI000BAAB06A|nr:Lrp/AsnC family transcriptional regulator [Actibacterium ureilyticum]
MDKTDQALIAALRQDGRRSVSDLALDLGVSRATVRSRLDRLTATGEIQGFTVVLRSETREMPVRAIMLIAIEGKNTQPVIRQLSGIAQVRSVHTTNGRWDLVIELATHDLDTFDAVLDRIRQIGGIAASETNLLLATRKSTTK